MDNNPTTPTTTVTPSQPAPPAPAANQPRKPSKALVVVILAIVLLVAVSVTLLLTRKTQAPSNNSTTESVQPASAQVTITSDGFSPATLQVKAHTQVTWTNNDDAAHQVAADPYPDDDSIAGFNKDNTVLQKGDTYSFIFDKAGTYTYHDELNPTKLQATVIVK